jgi:hypothetical protein
MTVRCARSIPMSNEQPPRGSRHYGVNDTRCKPLQEACISIHFDIVAICHYQPSPQDKTACGEQLGLEPLRDALGILMQAIAERAVRHEHVQRVALRAHKWDRCSTERARERRLVELTRDCAHLEALARERELDPFLGGREGPAS